MKLDVKKNKTAVPMEIPRYMFMNSYACQCKDINYPYNPVPTTEVANNEI